MHPGARLIGFHALVSSIGFAAISTIAGAQLAPIPTESSRREAGIGFEYVHPVGNFSLNEGNGRGVTAHFVFGLDSAAKFGVRFDADYIDFGSHTRTFPFDAVQQNTSNDVGVVTIGPQFSVRTGRFQPYINVGAGVAYFYSQKGFSTPAGGSELQGTTSYSGTNQVSLLYTGGAGLDIPVTVSGNEFAIDVGARFNSAKDAKYIPDNNSHMPGNYGASPLYQHEGVANFMGYHLGLSVRF